MSADVSPRFWRCPYFIVYDTGRDSYKAVDNSETRMSDGVGVQAARILEEMEIDAVLTGTIHLDALKTLSAIGIETYADQRGNVLNTLKRFRRGLLHSA